MTVEQIEGRNPVREALRAGGKLNKIVIARGSERGLKDIISMANAADILVERQERNWLDARSRTNAHQGVMAWRPPVEYVALSELIAAALAKSPDPLVVVLDGIQDPHNFGSVLRTAEAAGAAGVIIPKHRACGITPAVAKVSAGALEYVPVAQVTNLARSIAELKDAGFWVAGADMGGENLYFEVDLTGPIALVIGGEGKGLARLTKARCDFLVQLPMLGQINSLNAAVAGAILMYEAVRQRVSTGSR
ncbi:MAG: 23S rRNA (guanosine(2251)-2'-O)-methyltransferase RlmB [Firmicutes bacterium]|nr:23S rRNA (guanosine(2251)-2'-O)-methyltransferase RlmB [Bacillota bacterium]